MSDEHGVAGAMHDNENLKADPTLNNKDSDHQDDPFNDLTWLQDVVKDLPASQGKTCDLAGSDLPRARKIVSKLQNLYAELCNDQDNLNLKHDQANYEWDSFQYKAHFVRKSEQELLRTLETVENTHPTDPAVQQLRNAHHQLFGDLEAFSSQIKRLQDLQTSVRQKECDQQKRQALFLRDIKRLLHYCEELENDESHNILAGTRSESMSEHEPVLSVATKQPLHTAIAAYYARIGELKIMRERLEVLYTGHAEELATSQLTLDQGIPLEIPLEELRATFKERVRVAENDIKQASEAANDARRRCVEAGVESDIDEDLVNEGIWDGEVMGERSEDLDANGPPSPLALDLSNAIPSQETFFRRIVSSMHLTTLTGVPDSVVPLVRESSMEATSIRGRVQNWIEEVLQSTTDRPHHLTKSVPNVGSTAVIADLQPMNVASDDEWVKIPVPTAQPTVVHSPEMSAKVFTTSAPARLRSRSETAGSDYEAPATIAEAIERLRASK